MVPVLAPEFLVSPCKVLGAEGTEQRKFSCKDSRGNNLGKFPCMGTGRTASPGNPEHPQALLLGRNSCPAAHRSDRQ
jgi:hypothetical protein